MRRAVSLSASPRELTNTIVERWARIRSRMLASTCGQIEPAAVVWPAAGLRSGPSSAPRPPSDPGPPGGRLPADGGSPSRPSAAAAWGTGMSVMSSTGTATRKSSRREEGGLTTVTGDAPPRNAATPSTGRTVADSPTRCAGRGSKASRRSRLTARWAPRFVPATAWTSSTMTVRTPCRVSRARDVSMRKRDSGVVIRICGGRRRSRARSPPGVSPVRIPTSMRASGSPLRLRRAAIPCSGARRLRCTSAPSALSGET